MEFVENSNMKLPLLGLGTFNMHGDQMKAVVSESIKLGFELFDTATKYANEIDLGEIINGSQVLVQSKVHAAQLLGNIRYLRLNRKNIKKSFELSKERLRSTPYVYLLHSPFAGYENYFNELASLRENGVLKAIGVCNMELTQLKKLIDSTRWKPDIVQVEIHPYHSNKELIDYCKGQGIWVEARSPLAHGDAMEEWKSNTVLQDISSKYGKSIPQVILRWITQQNVIAIVRSTNVDHLKENINIFEFKLTGDELNKIDSLNRNQSFGFISSKR